MKIATKRHQLHASSNLLTVSIEFSALKNGSVIMPKHNQGIGMMRVRIREVSIYILKGCVRLKKGGKIEITPPVKSNIL